MGEGANRTLSKMVSKGVNIFPRTNHMVFDIYTTVIITSYITYGTMAYDTGNGGR
jgi:hypothetical protein